MQVNIINRLMEKLPDFVLELLQFVKIFVRKVPSSTLRSEEGSNVFWTLQLAVSAICALMKPCYFVEIQRKDHRLASYIRYFRDGSQQYP